MHTAVREQIVSAIEVYMAEVVSRQLSNGFGLDVEFVSVQITYMLLSDACVSHQVAFLDIFLLILQYYRCKLLVFVYKILLSLDHKLLQVSILFLAIIQPPLPVLVPNERCWLNVIMFRRQTRIPLHCLRKRYVRPRQYFLLDFMRVQLSNLCRPSLSLSVIMI